MSADVCGLGSFAVACSSEIVVVRYKRFLRSTISACLSNDEVTTVMLFLSFQVTHYCVILARQYRTGKS